MTSKHAQLWLNLHYSEIKHWLIVIVGFILIVFALLSYSTQNRLLDRVAVLSQQNKQLSQENKTLNIANQHYATATQKVVLQNRAYIKCLSTVFAQYTHDFVPVTIDNLDNCTIRTDGTSGSTSVDSGGLPVNQSVSSPNNTTPSSSPQPNKSQPQTVPTPSSPQPSFVQRVLSFVKRQL